MTTAETQLIRNRRITDQTEDEFPMITDVGNLACEAQNENGFEEVDLGSQSDDYMNAPSPLDVCHLVTHRRNMATLIG